MNRREKILKINGVKQILLVKKSCNMKSILKILLLALTCLTTNNMFAQRWVDFNLINQSGYSETVSIDTDLYGNVYTLGTYEDVNFGDTLYTLADRSIFLIKYNQNGERVWTNVYSGNFDVHGFTVKTDQCGNVYFTGTPTIGFVYLDTAVQTSPLFDPFIAKIDPDGKFLWAQNIPSMSTQVDFDLDENGNAYVIFQNQASGFFGSTRVQRGNSARLLSIGKFDADGNDMWLQQVGGHDDFSYHLAIDYYNGKLLAAGPMSNGDFALHMDTTGTTLRTFNTSTGSIETTAVLIDNQNNLLIGGSFTGNIRLAGTTLSPLGMGSSSSGNNDLFFVSFTPSGFRNWHRRLYALGPNINRPSIRDIALDNQSNYLICGMFTENFRFDNDSVTTVGGYHNGFIQKYSPQGTKIYREVVQQVNPSWSQNYLRNEIVGLAPQEDGTIYVVGYYHVNQAIFNNRTISNIGTWFGNTYIAKYADNTNATTGNVFFDLNNNSQKDTSESGESGVVIYLTNGIDTSYTLTNNAGDFNFQTDAGSYTLGVASPSKNWNISPTSIPVNIIQGGTVTLNSDFRKVATTSKTDFEVHISSYTQAAINDTSQFMITVKNGGTTTSNGSLSLTLDSLYNVIQFSTLPSSQNLNEYNWSVPSLLPNEIYNLNFTALLSQVAMTNDSIQLVATVVPNAQLDSDTTDNEDTLIQTINSSYQPNQLRVSPEGPLPADYLSGVKELRYTISFQNTTSETLKEMVVDIKIPSQANVSSLRILSSSHKINSFYDSKTSNLRFTFEEIALPSSLINSIDSRGFVNFGFRIDSSTAANDIIISTSSVQLNNCLTDTLVAPVVTFRDSSLLTSLSTIQNKSSSIGLIIFPNPSKHQITVVGEIDEIELYSVIGQQLDLSGKTNKLGIGKLSIDIQSLSNGIYFIKTTNAVAKFQKL